MQYNYNLGNVVRLFMSVTALINFVIINFPIQENPQCAAMKTIEIGDDCIDLPQHNIYSSNPGNGSCKAKGLTDKNTQAEDPTKSHQNSLLLLSHVHLLNKLQSFIRGEKRQKHIQ
jgi:hypothetical protein